MVVFVVKRYAVRESKKWRYTVRNAKIGWYAVRNGGGGVTLTLHVSYYMLCLYSSFIMLVKKYPYC